MLFVQASREELLTISQTKYFYLEKNQIIQDSPIQQTDHSIQQAHLTGPHRTWEDIVKSMWPEASLVPEFVENYERTDFVVVDLGEGWGKLPYCCSSVSPNRAWTAAYTYLSQKGLL